MWASICPECGTDVARVPPCRFCGGYCCPCVHEDEREAERLRSARNTEAHPSKGD